MKYGGTVLFAGLGIICLIAAVAARSIISDTYYYSLLTLALALLLGALAELRFSEMKETLDKILHTGAGK